MYIINDLTTGFSYFYHYAFLRQKLNWKMREEEGEQREGMGRRREKRKREMNEEEWERRKVFLKINYSLSPNSDFMCTYIALRLFSVFKIYVFPQC